MLKRMFLVPILSLIFIGSVFYNIAPLEDILLKFLEKLEISYNTESELRIFTTDIRWLYNKYIDDIGIDIVEKTTGYKVFIKGPHSYGNMNFDAITDFGHYNPEFLKYVNETIDQLQSDRMFTYYGQLAYDNSFKEFVRYYYEAYNYLNIPNDEKIKFTNSTMNDVIEVYKKKMQNYNRVDWLVFLPFSQFMHEHGYSLGGSKTCSFWIRRKMDGTDKLFYEIINKLLDTFDKDFKRQSIF